MKEYVILGLVIIGIISWCWILLDPVDRLQYDKPYIQNGMNCFANGVLCKNISCESPGGCSAKDCIGGLEYYGALRIKCINISRSK